MLRVPFACLFVAATALAVPVSSARACSGPPPCSEVSAYPGTASLPANVSGIWIDRGWTSGDFIVTSSLTLEPTDGPARAIPFTEVDVGPAVRLAFDETLPVGATLRYDATTDCEYANTASRSWTITEPVAVPNALGTLELGEVDRSGIAPSSFLSASCTALVPAATGRVALTDEASFAPWKDLVVYETIVDGTRWDPYVVLLDTYVPFSFGGSRVGRGVDEVFVHCDPEERGRLAAGSHTVSMRAYLPNGTVLESNAVEVELRCASASEAGDCAAAPAHGAPSALPLVALGLVALGLRRRRG